LKNGGSEIQYKVLNAVQSNIDHRRNQLQKNPQSVFAMDSGTPLQPLSPESALQQPGEWGAGLKQRQVIPMQLSKNMVQRRERIY
jgi:hypothetical protein